MCPEVPSIDNGEVGNTTLFYNDETKITCHACHHTHVHSTNTYADVNLIMCNVSGPSPTDPTFLSETPYNCTSMFSLNFLFMLIIRLSVISLCII